MKTLLLRALATIGAILLWIVWLALSLALTLLGLVVIPIALSTGWCMVTRPSQIIAGRRVTTFDGPLWIFGNEEDGLAPEWYLIANPALSLFDARFRWSALRNSVNNLQRVPYLNCKLEPTLLRVRKWPGGSYWCRQGIYAGAGIVVRGRTIRLGYALIPYMVKGLPVGDTRDLPYVSAHWGIT